MSAAMKSHTLQCGLSMRRRHRDLSAGHLVELLQDGGLEYLAGLRAGDESISHEERRRAGDADAGSIGARLVEDGIIGISGCRGPKGVDIGNAGFGSKAHEVLDAEFRVAIDVPAGGIERLLELIELALRRGGAPGLGRLDCVQAVDGEVIPLDTHEPGINVLAYKPRLGLVGVARAEGALEVREL